MVSGVSVGSCWIINAAVPATTGVAMEVRRRIAWMLCEDKPVLSSCSSAENPGARRMSTAPIKLAISITFKGERGSRQQTRPSGHHLAGDHCAVDTGEPAKRLEAAVLLFLQVHPAVGFGQ
jgi:hypothetical protein